MHKQALDAPAAAAPDAITRISNWFHALTPEKKHSLIGGLSGAAIGGGALGLSQALAPSQQDSATGKRRKKGVLSKAVLGAILGGTAGTGLGYAGSRAGIIPTSDSGLENPGLLRRIRRERLGLPIAGGLGGLAVSLKVIDPNRQTRVSALNKLRNAYRSGRIPEKELAGLRFEIESNFGPGGPNEFGTSRRFRTMDLAHEADIAAGRVLRVPGPGLLSRLRSKLMSSGPMNSRTMLKVRGGTAAAMNRKPMLLARKWGYKLRPRKSWRSPATLFAGVAGGTGVGEVGRRTIWKEDLAAMRDTANSDAREAAIRRMEGR